MVLKPHFTVVLTIAAACLLDPGAASAQFSPEELVLYVARAQDLAGQTLDDAVPRIGVLMAGIGPSSAAATGEQGFGHGSLSLGSRGAEFSVTNPDYSVSDPAGDDRVDGAIAAAYADLSLGLLHLDRGPRTTVLGSLDLLLRYGLTVGDQPNIADSVDLGQLKSIYGAGLRFGLLAGRDVPRVSLAAGVNHLAARTFSVNGLIVDGDTEVPYRVDLEFAETSYFALLEVSRKFGVITPYFAGGLTRHHLTSDYAAVVVFDADAAEQSRLADAVEIWQTQPIAYGGVELGGRLGLVLEGGVTEDGGFGSVYLHLHR